MTIKITQLGNLTGVYGNTIVPVVANIAGDWTTVKGNLTQISAYTNLAELPYGNIIPAADAVYSLGTASYRFKDLYLLGSTIYLGNATISVSNAAVVASLPITAPAVTVGNTTITAAGNISVNSISVTDTIIASNITAAGSVTATEVTTTGNITAGDVTTSGTVTAGDVTTSGTVTAGDVTTSGNITASNISISGNTITLGGATLDVSSGTLESSIPIAAPITSTGNLTIQGVSINFAQGSYIDEGEFIGQPGTYGLGLNSPDDGVVAMNALDANASITSSVFVSNVSVQLNVANVDLISGNVNVWMFDNTGGLLFPDGTYQDTAYDLTTAYGNINVNSYLLEYNGFVGNLVQINTANVNIFAPLNVGFPSDISFANVIIAGTNDVNGYAQLNVQNKNTVGTAVSADFIATAPNGTDSTNYIDVGINGNNYSQASWTISGANDGYVYINGGNLTVGTDTPNKTVSVHVGGLLAENIVTTFSSTDVTVDANLVVGNTYVPSLANSAGTAGQVVWDSSYVYICVATNTWKRANISTW